MDPKLPFNQNKKNIWQTLHALPLAIKSAIISFGLLAVTGGTILWWLSSVAPSPPLSGQPHTTQKDDPGSSKAAEDASTTPEEEAKKQEEAKNNIRANKASPQTPASTTPEVSSSNAPSATPPPVGNARPSSSNTGPTSTPTTTYTGAVSNSSSNQTFENIDFPAPGTPGYYIFSGNNITLRNCSIHGNGILFSGDNITVENCIIEGGVSLSGTNGVTFRYNEVLNFSGDGIHLTSDSGQAANVSLAHNYIHRPTPGCGDHADGIQVRGVDTLSLYNNTFDMGPWVQVCGQDALNAAVFFESANGGNSNITVDGNYLNGAGITLRLSPGSNQRITNNRFGHDYKYNVVSNQTSGGDITQNTDNVMDNNNSVINF